MRTIFLRANFSCPGRLSLGLAFRGLPTLFFIFLASYQSLTLAGPSTPPPPPQKTPLAFSATPTAEEIFRSHIFEEPLVPVGREPTPLENAALASALIGYSKRSSVDDFVSLTTFLGSLITGLINSQGRST